MPAVYPPAHTRVAFLGNLLQAPGGGSDIFEFGWADASALGLQALATALAPVMGGAWESASASLQVSMFAQLTGCRVEAVEADGKVSGSFYVAISPVVGLNQTHYCTLLTQAITLETTTPNDHGRFVQGRFFPPASAAGFEGSTCDTGDNGGYAHQWSLLMKQMVGAGSVPAVASRTGGGQIANVTSVSCSTGMDTQRRRKNHVTLQRSDKYSISS